MNALKIIYNSFIWGLTAAILAFQNVWLEMRINTGLIVPAAAIVSAAVLSILKAGKKLSFRFSVINLIICLTISFLTLGAKRIQIVPASIIREGLDLTQLSFDNINISLSILLAFCLIAIYLGDRKKSY